MAASVIAVEWLNQNALRNYPFREDCALRPNDSAGALIEDGWRLPNNLVTDFVLTVPGADYDPTIYLKRLSVVNRTLALTFADAEGTDVVSVSAEEIDTVKAIAGVGSFSGARGSIAFGNLSRFFDETPDGLYAFEIGESLIEPTCIRPSAAGVTSLAVVSANGYETRGLIGRLKLVAGTNINFSYDVEHNAIVVSADPNSGYSPGCVCDKDDERIVRSINGIRTQDVILVGDDCVDVKTDVGTGVIRISDKCSKPCCGCAETAFINQSINDLQSSVNTLQRNTTLLSDRVTNFINNYLLSRKTII